MLQADLHLPLLLLVSRPLQCRATFGPHWRGSSRSLVDLVSSAARSWSQWLSVVEALRFYRLEKMAAVVVVVVVAVVVVVGVAA